VDTDGTVISDVFVNDDGNGILNLVAKNSGGTIYTVYPRIGTVDYDNGKIAFNSAFAPVSTSVLFTITVEPRNEDIFVFENKIVRINRGYSDSVKLSVQSQTNRKQNLKA
jgi:hypothetical protein